MKKTAVFLLAFAAVFVPARAQKLVENPDKPSGPEAGRVLRLKEESRITDESGDFFLKYPRFVKIAPDGSFYILDVEQIIHLDAGGKFLGNLYRKGQGPGELNFVTNIDFAPDAVVIHSYDPHKLVWFDGRGKASRDVSLQKAGGRLDFLGLSGGRVIALQLRMPSTDASNGVMMQEAAFRSVSADGSEMKDLAVFPVRTLRIEGAMLWDRVVSVLLKGRYVALSHAKDYTVKIIDCREPKPALVFNRKYKKVPAPKDYRGGAISSSDGTRYELPGSEFLDDVVGLYAYKDVLWVQTSTRDNDKGILFDVFDLEGRYIDAFYLKTAGRLLSVQGDSLFIRESAPDDSLRIVRYRIVG